MDSVGRVPGGIRCDREDWKWLVRGREHAWYVNSRGDFFRRRDSVPFALLVHGICCRGSYCVRYKDKDKANNCRSNLELLPYQDYVFDSNFVR